MLIDLPALRPGQLGTVIYAAAAAATTAAHATPVVAAAAAVRCNRMRAFVSDLRRNFRYCGCVGSAAAFAGGSAGQSVSCSVCKQPPSALWTTAISTSGPPHQGCSYGRLQVHVLVELHPAAKFAGHHVDEGAGCK